MPEIISKWTSVKWAIDSPLPVCDSDNWVDHRHHRRNYHITGNRTENHRSSSSDKKYKWEWNDCKYRLKYYFINFICAKEENASYVLCQQLFLIYFSNWMSSRRSLIIPQIGRVLAYIVLIGRFPRQREIYYCQRSVGKGWERNTSK